MFNVQIETFNTHISHQFLLTTNLQNNLCEFTTRIHKFKR